MKTLFDYVKIYQFNADICKKVINQYQNNPNWESHTWYAANDGNYVTKKDKELQNLHLNKIGGTGLPHVGELVQIHYDASIKYFNDLSPGASPLVGLCIPRLNKYGTGTVMRTHFDHIHDIFDGTVKGIPVLSILLGLNSQGQDYTGGDFILCGEKITLNAGQAVVFPSNFMYPHEVKEVMSGTRYSSICWAW